MDFLQTVVSRVVRDCKFNRDAAMNVFADAVDAFITSEKKNRTGPGQAGIAKRPEQVARPGCEPSAEQRRASASIKKGLAPVILTALDKIKTSDGKRWGDIRAHELTGMGRDGTIARGMLAQLGPLNNAQYGMTLRELDPTAKYFNKVLRELNNAA